MIKSGKIEHEKFHNSYLSWNLWDHESPKNKPPWFSKVSLDKLIPDFNQHSIAEISLLYVDKLKRFRGGGTSLIKQFLSLNFIPYSIVIVFAEQEGLTMGPNVYSLKEWYGKFGFVDISDIVGCDMLKTWVMLYVENEIGKQLYDSITI